MKETIRYEMLEQRIAPIYCEMCGQSDLEVLARTGDLGIWWTDNDNVGLTICNDCKKGAEGKMNTLHMPKKINTTEKPWQNERGMGMAKGYKKATILDSFVFYGRDIPEKRYRFYTKILKIRNPKS